MATPIVELHGTWQEIVASHPDTGQQRLRVVVFPEDADSKSDTQQLAVLREIAERGQHMTPRPDTADYLAEARSGAMFVRETGS